MSDKRLSKSQIDRLGDRLRTGTASDNDVRLLNDHRLSFIDPYDAVVRTIQDDLNLKPTGRAPKTLTSILEKLKREHVRLSQMQDIAGCRVVVKDLRTQDAVVRQLQSLFEKVSLDDRREHPSHGYRAVHIIVEVSGKLVEIQVRTELQNNWAQFSEKLSDVLGGEIKYGGGDNEVVSLLVGLSEITEGVEIATETMNIDGIRKNVQRLLDSFELLRKVILRAKQDDISN